jgi:hypothetical protein
MPCLLGKKPAAFFRTKSECFGQKLPKTPENPHPQPLPDTSGQASRGERGDFSTEQIFRTDNFWKKSSDSPKTSFSHREKGLRFSQKLPKTASAFRSLNMSKILFVRGLICSKKEPIRNVLVFRLLHFFLKTQD